MGWAKMAKINKFKVILTLIFFGIFIFLYPYRLNDVPVHLNQDELMFSLNAESIAQNGHDFYGTFMPFYFLHLDTFWATPVTTYLTAMFLKFLPLSEMVIRLPSVFVAVLSVILVMFLINRIFNSFKITFLSGVLMMLSPGLFINSRVLLDNIYIIPFLILWLIFIYNYIKSDKNIYLFFAGLSLGLGIHSYHAAKIYMPLYLSFSLLALLVSKANLKKFAILIFGFVIPIIVFIPWLRQYPDTLFSQVRYVSGIDNQFLKFNISRIINSYLSYFNPKILFTSGDATLIHSTTKSGVFPFVTVFLLLFGFLEMAKRKDLFSKILVLGVVTFPIAPALINDAGRISRALIIIPFVIIVAAYGIYYLSSSKDLILRKLLYILFGIVIIEFSIFQNDYFGDYRIRSSSVFNNNIAGAIESAQKSLYLRKVERVYLDNRIPFVNYYYKFYQIKNKTNFSEWIVVDLSVQDFTKFPKGSLVILSTSNFPSGKPEKIAGFEKIETIRELNGYETFLIYFK